MSLFSNAQNTNAQGSTFNQIGRDQFNIGQVVNTGTTSKGWFYMLYLLTVCHCKLGASLEELLHKYVVPDAAYNCRGIRVGCLSGTRQPVIEKVKDWIAGNDTRQM